MRRAFFVGSYERRPVENEWHQVSIALEGDGLRWSNGAGVSWALAWDGRELSAPYSPYGRQILAAEGEVGRDGAIVLPIEGVWFNGELYTRVE